MEIIILLYVIIPIAWFAEKREGIKKAKKEQTKSPLGTFN